MFFTRGEFSRADFNVALEDGKAEIAITQLLLVELVPNDSF